MTVRTIVVVAAVVVVIIASGVVWSVISRTAKAPTHIETQSDFIEGEFELTEVTVNGKKVDGRPPTLPTAKPIEFTFRIRSNSKRLPSRNGTINVMQHDGTEAYSLQGTSFRKVNYSPPYTTVFARIEIRGNEGPNAFLKISSAQNVRFSIPCVLLAPEK